MNVLRQSIAVSVDSVKACILGCLAAAVLCHVPVRADTVIKPSYTGSLRGTYDYRSLGEYEKNRRILCR